ncbi:MAG: N-formylglutamate deformylase [uncultured Sphingomonadaceae bacterium]|uniref:N-formylglutamate deformylase n=1 Tax=uncultured Sphingomonadaceae bacterium TaxID=169976 RepID=A0A6J4T3P0_9SPHN|nr:MAG: N-formylglutamate deformylase [uncultured Sphingomonadaceae bacterium]
MDCAPAPLPAFVPLGPAEPTLPVLLSVPHAGRAYLPELLAAARAPGALRTLEDPLVDQLVADAAARGAGGIAATVPRAAIDLNRALAELDPAGIDPAPPRAGLLLTARVRGGLGLFPRSTNGEALWRGLLPAAEAARRVREIHVPYHAELARRLRALRDRFGAAVLLDCHSMPPLAASASPGRVDAVIGDRHGATADRDLVRALRRSLEASGLVVALDQRDAGGHVVERHGCPAWGLHAIQLEIDRALYLGPDGASPGPGFARTAAAIAATVDALAAALPVPRQIAAE